MADSAAGWDTHRHGQHPTPQPVYAGYPPVAPGSAEDRTEVLAATARAGANRPSDPTQPPRPAPMGPAGYAPPAAPYGPAATRYPYAFTAPAPRKRPISLRLYGIGAAVVIAAVASAAIAMGAGADSTGSEATASQPGSGSAGAPVAAPMIGTADLEGLLLDNATLNDELGMALELRDMPGATTMYTDIVDRPQCIGAVVPASREAYADSGWISVRKSMHTGVDTAHSSVTQAIVSFPTADRATEFIAAQTQAWQSCDGQTVALDPDDDPLPVTVASVGSDGITVTAIAFPEGTSNSGCDRALRAEGNVVVDVQNCGAQPSQNAARVAVLIAERTAAS